MNNNALQKRVSEWQNALRSWQTYKKEFEGFTRPYDPYTLTWLEGYLRDTYGDIMRPIVDKLKGRPTGRRDWPFVYYLLHVAEQVEPLFKMRLQAVVESFLFSDLELMRVRSDYLGYLLCGNADEEPARFHDALNKEIAVVEKVLALRYSQAVKLKPLVNSMITKTKQSQDFESKQYIILVALFLEPHYRKRFLPDGKSFLAKPKRFMYFMKQILKPLIFKLRNGNIGGLSEFVKEARPAYMMID